jgi:hypothetical protein
MPKRWLPGILGRPVKPGDDSSVCGFAPQEALLPRLQLAWQRKQFGRG